MIRAGYFQQFSLESLSFFTNFQFHQGSRIDVEVEQNRIRVNIDWSNCCRTKNCDLSAFGLPSHLVSPKGNLKIRPSSKVFH